MQINPVIQNSYSSNHPSFAGNRLFKVPIFVNETKELNSKLKPQWCYFTEMNEEDVELAENLRLGIGKSGYGGVILDMFQAKIKTLVSKIPSWKHYMEEPEKFHFYMIESAAETNPQKRVKALALATEISSNNELWVDLLQVAGKTNSHTETNEKGVGSMMMYGLSRVAQNMDKNEVTLVPTHSSKPWYGKLGLSFENDVFHLKKNKYDEFQSKMEEKFSFTKKETIPTEEAK